MLSTRKLLIIIIIFIISTIINVQILLSSSFKLNKDILGNIILSTSRKVDREIGDALSTTNQSNTVDRRALPSIGPSTNRGPPRPIVLWTSWRSGSSFLGDLMAKTLHGSTFYSYEPLFYKGFKVFADASANDTQDAVRFLADLLKCNVRGRHQEFVRANADLQFPLAANPLYQETCVRSRLCADDKVFEETCRSADLHVAKIVRLGLRFAEVLLQELPDLQVVYLIRDPRPVMRSRQSSETRRWCNPKHGDCWSPDRVCRLLMEDILLLPALLQKYPNRFFFLKYEELSLNPSEVIHDLWHKLQLPLTDIFVEYLNRTTHGSKPKEQRIDTSRNTRDHTFVWRQNIEWGLVEDVQAACGDVIRSLGWRVFRSEEDLRDMAIGMGVEEEWNIM